MKRTSRAAHSTRRLAAASVVLAAMAAAGMTAPASADPSATVSGTVSRADGGSPEGIVVASYCDDDDSGSAGYGSSSTQAAADGSYSLVLPPSYAECPSVLLEFRDPTGTYAPQFYGGATFDYEATNVGFTPGDTALAPETLSYVAGAIRGRVFDTYGHRVHDRDLQVRANSDIFEDAIPAPLLGIGRKGGFLLPGLLPAGYVVESYNSARYADATTGWGPKQLIRVTAGKTATSPRLVVKDRARLRFTTTWRAHAATVRIRVSSKATGRAAAGTAAVSIRSAQGNATRKHIRLSHGRAVVTVRLAKPRGSATVSVSFNGSRHVARADRQRIYRFGSARELS